MAEVGDYIGYTEGHAGYPTLYFDNGHLTQRHGDVNNIGWHPNVENATVIQRNVNEETHQKVEAVWDNNNEAELYKLLQKIIDGEEHRGDDVKLLEIFLIHVEGDNYRCIGWHSSRGKLIRRRDRDFNQAYGHTYAVKQVRSSMLAANENDMHAAGAWQNTRLVYTPSRYP